MHGEAPPASAQKRNDGWDTREKSDCETRAVAKHSSQPPRDNDRVVQLLFPFVEDIDHAVKLISSIDRQQLDEVKDMLGRTRPVAPGNLYFHKHKTVFWNEEQFYLLLEYGLELTRIFG